ncbi:hypothetical protein ACHQM5_002083 [Ranunculus cassubicifolius]
MKKIIFYRLIMPKEMLLHCLHSPVISLNFETSFSGTKTANASHSNIPKKGGT